MTDAELDALVERVRADIAAFTFDLPPIDSDDTLLLCDAIEALRRELPMERGRRKRAEDQVAALEADLDSSHGRVRRLAEAVTAAEEKHAKMLVYAQHVEARLADAERDVTTLGNAFRLVLLGEQVIHGLSEQAIKEVVTAFKSVFPKGFDDPKLAVPESKGGADGE